MPDVNFSRIIILGLVAVVLLRAIQYLLLARVYLTCAVRRLSVQLVDPKDMDANDREILGSAHEALASAGYRPLLTAKAPVLLTLYERPEYFLIYLAEKLPISLHVRRRMAPEAGASVALLLETSLENGRKLVTSNLGDSLIINLADDLEDMPNAAIAALESRHMERIAASGSRPVAPVADPTSAIANEAAALQAMNRLLRQTGYTAPTSDPDLDRITLRGAFSWAHASLRAARRRKRIAPNASTPTQEQLRLRAIADARAVLAEAQHPVRAPGSSTPLLVIMLTTAALSFAGMSYLWSTTTAIILLAVIAFHEAGHAIAMRQLGYQDVNVFFVPLLGALTIGREAGASLRNRVRVMLAGPVPGLWLAVILLLWQVQFGHARILTGLIMGLLLINVFNLLPITPLDGGRALELLTRPDGILRVVIQALSGLVLLALGALLGDAVTIVLGVLWLGLLRRQFALYKLRRTVNAELTDRADRSAVVGAVCGVFASPTYASWKSSVRIAMARALARQFLGLQLAPGDRLRGAFGYVSAWIPVLTAVLIVLMLWNTPEGVPLDWATLQSKLGNVFQGLGRRAAGTARLEQAVAAYQEALKLRSRERMPLDWARTQNNLGNALATLGERESGSARLEQAVAAYQKALQERMRERVPLDWARTQNNLGNALATLGERESVTARLEQAVAAYQEALKERTRERVPLDWARTQNGLGFALWRLGQREPGTARLEQAVAACQEALKEATRERVPRQWVATQNNLGNALENLGERERGTARLEQSVAAYQEALKETTRERAPPQWAMTQNNLGVALWRLGERESGTAHLEQAVVAHREALKEHTRDRVPLYWAMTQSNLGDALASLGERESGTARLEQAVAAYQEALKERPRERVPLDWARTQDSLARALLRLGERESGTAPLEGAIQSFTLALEAYHSAGTKWDLSDIETNRKRAQAELARRRSK
jgi:tetratricopeptide (TPR) repeat protein